MDTALAVASVLRCAPSRCPDFELGLARGISTCHFGRSVPLIYAIDMDHCIHCYQCVTAWQT